MVAWKKIMGKFEVGHWMGATKEEDGMREREQKDFGPVSAFYTAHLRCHKALSFQATEILFGGITECVA